jgi:hypothetical protein
MTLAVEQISQIRLRIVGKAVRGHSDKRFVGPAAQRVIRKRDFVADLVRVGRRAGDVRGI